MLKHDSTTPFDPKKRVSQASLDIFSSSPNFSSKLNMKTQNGCYIIEKDESFIV